MNQLFDRGGKNSSIFVNFHLFVFCCEVSYLVSSFAQVDLDGGNGVDWVTKMVRYIIHYCYIVKVANFDFVKKHSIYLVLGTHRLYGLIATQKRPE